MGYKRSDLLEKGKDLYTYSKTLLVAQDRAQEITIRNIERERILSRREEIETEVTKAKEEIKNLKKAKIPIPEYLTYIASRADRIKFNKTQDPSALNAEELAELEEAATLRTPPALQEIVIPEKPFIPRYETLNFTLEELMVQGDYIGCYPGLHPARALYSDTMCISEVEEDDYLVFTSGIVLEFKEILTKLGDPMAFLKYGDGTGIGEAVIFPRTFKELKDQELLPVEGDLVKIYGQAQDTDPILKVILKQIEIHKRETNDTKDN